MISFILMVALVTTIYLFLKHIAELEAAWALERRELLSRIQRPDQIPVTPAKDFVVPEMEPDDIGLVGSVTFETEAGQQLLNEDDSA